MESHSSQPISFRKKKVVSKGEVHLPIYYKIGPAISKHNLQAYQQLLRFVSYNQKQQFGFGAQDITNAPQSWWSTFVRARELHALGFTGKGIRVVIADTGVPDHEDLEEHQNFDLAKDFSDSRDYYDKNGHSTHCMGIAALVAKHAEFVALKVLGDDGSGSYEGIAAAVDYAIEIKADVLSMSLGGSADAPVLHEAIKRAYRAGITIVCAAGNSGDDGDDSDNDIGYPGRYPEVICVEAVNKKLLPAYFTSDGDEADIAAPGRDIDSTYLGNTYRILSGTSMATPCVAGLVALMIEQGKARGLNLTPKDVYTIMTQNAIDKGKPGWDRYYGFGIADHEKTVNAVASFNPGGIC